MSDGMRSFHCHGKLLLTGEYAVLEGSKAFSLPTTYGQSFVAEPLESLGSSTQWTSLDYQGKVWFQCTLRKDLSIKDFSDASVARNLEVVLQEAKKLNKAATEKLSGKKITTQLDFPNNWGLGSSSTFIVNLSNYLGIDPYQLLFKSFGGSGYDIATALHSQPLLYTLKDGLPEVELISYLPSFQDELFFVYLGKKQNSREEIKAYQSRQAANKRDILTQISAISEKIPEVQSVVAFTDLLFEHEELISELIGRQLIKNQLFSDYNGVVKSLGAWGGDFVLAVGGQEERNYFKQKGYQTMLEYSEMVLA